MQKPFVMYDPDETIKEFIGNAVGSTTQDIMIGSEILSAAGLASRELTLADGTLRILFCASPALKSRLKTLETDAGDRPKKL
jgi:hypothetical protein